MYLVSSLPILLSIPVAFYLHTRSCFDKILLNKDNTALNIIIPPQVNDTIASQPTGNEAHILSNLVDKIFGTRRFGVIDIYDMYLEVNNSRIERNGQNIFDIVGELNTNDFVSSIIFHLVVTCACVFILNFTLLGISARIIVRRLYRSGKWLQSLPSKVKVYFSEKVIQYSNDDGEIPSDNDMDCFVECASDMEMVEREESVPKANQAEEKGLKKESVSMDHDTSSSSFQQLTKNVDSGIVEISDGERLNNDVIINPDTKPLYTSSDDPINMETLDGDTSNMLTSTLLVASTGEATPEKFKRFLHERNEEMDRLGISLDKDGYIEEEDSNAHAQDCEASDYQSNNNKRSILSTLNDTLWEKINLLI